MDGPGAVRFGGKLDVTAAALHQFVDGVEDGLSVLTLQTDVAVGICNGDSADGELLPRLHLLIVHPDQVAKDFRRGALVEVGPVDAITEQAQLTLAGHCPLSVNGIGLEQRPTTEPEHVASVDGHDGLVPHKIVIGGMSCRHDDLGRAADVDAPLGGQTQKVVVLQAAVIGELPISIHSDTGEVGGYRLHRLIRFHRLIIGQVVVILIREHRVDVGRLDSRKQDGEVCQGLRSGRQPAGRLIVDGVSEPFCMDLHLGLGTVRVHLNGALFQIHISAVGHAIFGEAGAVSPVGAGHILPVPGDGLLAPNSCKGRSLPAIEGRILLTGHAHLDGNGVLPGGGVSICPGIQQQIIVVIRCVCLDRVGAAQVLVYSVKGHHLSTASR